MNLIDLLHRPVAECLKTLRRQPRANPCKIDDRPRIESLESRIAPANLLVAVTGHTLNITGDAGANTVAIDGDAGDATIFHVFSPSDTINGGPGSIVTPPGVTSISIKLFGGDDEVTFTNTVPIHLQGSLAIDGGSGANKVSATALNVAKNLSITNGANATGTDQNLFTNLFVGGSLTIKNGDGDTNTQIGRNSAATVTDFSAILGNLSVTNGSGKDTIGLSDTNVGKNVTFSNGHGDAGGTAGIVTISNVNNTASHSVIGGNLSVMSIDGRSVGNFLADTTVLGDVSYDHGTGAGGYGFDGSGISDSVFIRGSLTIKGAGGVTVTVGNSSTPTTKLTGLIVGKNLSITDSGTASALTFSKLQVGAATKLALGAGANGVTIDDSTFIGAFGLTTGSGGDQVQLDTDALTSRATIFEKPVSINLGKGADNLSLGGTDHPNETLIVYSTFVIHTGGDLGDLVVPHATQEFLPLGGSIVVLP